MNRDIEKIALEIGMEVGDFGLELISVALRPLRKIEFLSLTFVNCNEITSDGVIILGDVLSSLLSLT